MDESLEMLHQLGAVVFIVRPVSVQPSHFSLSSTFLTPFSSAASVLLRLLILSLLELYVSDAT